MAMVYELLHKTQYIAVFIFLVFCSLRLWSILLVQEDVLSLLNVSAIPKRKKETFTGHCIYTLSPISGYLISSYELFLDQEKRLFPEFSKDKDKHFYKLQVQWIEKHFI